MDQQISRFDTNTNDSGEQPNHGVGRGLRLLLQSFLASFLDLPDLADDKAQPRHVALQLGQGVRRQRYALRGVHGCKTLGGLAQGWFEVANPQPGEGGLYPVHNPLAFHHQAVALAVRPLGVLFGNRGHARHAAMAPFSTQPPQEPALQQLGVEPVGFRSTMFPRYRDTRGMDHVSLYSTRRKPARQPKPVAAGFEGNRNPRDRAAGPGRFILPAMQQAKQTFWVRLQLLARLTLNSGKHAGNEPARLAHLDDGYDRAILVQGDEGPAQVVRLGHRGTPSLDAATKLPCPRRPPHSISPLEDEGFELPVPPKAGVLFRTALYHPSGRQKPCRDRCSRPERDGSNP